VNLKMTFILPFLATMVFALPAEDDMQAEFERQVAVIGQALVPDRRLDLLTTEVRPVGSTWEVTGETTIAAARTAVEEAARKVFASRLGRVHIALLPDPALGPRNQGLVRVSVAPLRKLPKHSAEMVDQVTMGAIVQILKTEPGWLMVRTAYRYLGWIEDLMLTRISAEERSAWEGSSLARFAKPTGVIWASQDESQPVSDIVLGCVVKASASDETLTQVELPDGRKGFVQADSLVSLQQASKIPDREGLVSLALRLHGIPYLWGGNSAKGFDCSGFTQTVFRMHELELPRDADQQSQSGRLIEPDSEFSNVEPGDLLFFGEERITHVAISLGGARYIHASVDVNISSLKEGDHNYDPGRKQRLKYIRRVIE
jgi:gamma-D-glutamyl-L-lysine dipeptidyl-peptidase